MSESKTFASGTLINSGWLNAVNDRVFNRLTQIATAGQTVVNIPNGYSLGGSMLVFRNGLLQEYGVVYSESGVTTITFTSGLTVGDKITTFG